MSDDDQALSRADRAFIIDRMLALDAEAQRDAATAEDAYRRAILDLLRSGTPPSQKTLRLIAGELDRLWWPKAYNQQRKRASETAWLAVEDDLKNNLVAAELEQGEPKPRTEAEKKVAEILGVDVGALRRRRTRYRKRTRI